MIFPIYKRCSFWQWTIASWLQRGGNNIERIQKRKGATTFEGLRYFEAFAVNDWHRKPIQARKNKKEVSTEIQATFRKYIKGTKENKEEREKILTKEAGSKDTKDRPLRNKNMKKKSKDYSTNKRTP